MKVFLFSTAIMDPIFGTIHPHGINKMAFQLHSIVLVLFVIQINT